MQKFILPLSLLFLSTTAFAEDGGTYNFYFQKAPGPVTVNQSGSAPSNPNPAPPTPSTPAPTAIPTATPANQPSGGSVASVDGFEGPKWNRWHVSFGYTMFVNAPAATAYEIATTGEKSYFDRQLAVGAEYDLSKMFSVGGTLYKVRDNVNLQGGIVYDSTGQDPIGQPVKVDPDSPADKTVIDYSIYGVANILHSANQAFQLAVLGGYQTVPYVQYRALPTNDPRYQAGISNSNGNGDMVTYPTEGVQHEGTLFGGARIRLLVDQTWGAWRLPTATSPASTTT